MKPTNHPVFQRIRGPMYEQRDVDIKPSPYVSVSVDVLPK
jgi:hypothetical protein